MAQAHGDFAGIVVIVTIAFAVAVAAVALAARGRRLLVWGPWAVLAVLAVQGALGIATYASGHRPAEKLHLLYGVLVFLPLPFARSFASQAEPKPRAWTIFI